MDKHDKFSSTSRGGLNGLNQRVRAWRQASSCSTHIWAESVLTNLPEGNGEGDHHDCEPGSGPNAQPERGEALQQNACKMQMILIVIKSTGYIFGRLK